MPGVAISYALPIYGTVMRHLRTDYGWTRTRIRGVPPVPSDYISVKLSMQDGVPAKTTEKALLEVERARLEVVDYLVSQNEPNPFRYVMKTMGAQPFSGGPKRARLIS